MPHVGQKRSEPSDGGRKFSSGIPVVEHTYTICAGSVNIHQEVVGCLSKSKLQTSITKSSSYLISQRT